MTNDEILFTCECCGKQFAPDPDAMMEMEWDQLTDEMLANMTEIELKDWGLTEEDRQAMLSGEAGLCDCEECMGEDLPSAGAICMCPECRSGESFVCDCPYCQCDESRRVGLRDYPWWRMLAWACVGGLLGAASVQIVWDLFFK